jgi:hypothetical protein
MSALPSNSIHYYYIYHKDCPGSGTWKRRRGHYIRLAFSLYKFKFNCLFGRGTCLESRRVKISSTGMIKKFYLIPINSEDATSAFRNPAKYTPFYQMPWGMIIEGTACGTLSTGIGV